MNKKSVTAIIGVILMVLLTLAVASSMYFWLTKIQKGSQESATGIHEQTLKNVITQAKLIDDPDYDSLAEGDPCLDATLTLNIQNIGAREIPLTTSATAPRTEIIISDPEKVICISELSGACLSRENYIYAGTGNTGAVYRSSDGVTWTYVKDLNDKYIYALEKFENGYFAGTGGNSKLIESCDGTTWAERDSLGMEQVLTLETFGNYLYAGTGKNGSVYRSADGLNWSLAHSFNNDTEKYVYALKVFGNYLYAGLGANTTQNGSVYRSADGLNWNNVANLSNKVYSLEVFDSNIYAGTGESGKIYRSNTGNVGSWNLVKDTGDQAIRALYTFNGAIYAGSQNYTASTADGKIYKSTDGAIWDLVHTTSDRAVVSFAVFNNNLFAGTEESATEIAHIINSSDGVNWGTVNHDFNRTVRALINFTRCTKSKVECTEGCDSYIGIDASRIIRLRLSNTVCDISNYGTDTSFTFKLNFGTEAQLISHFKKEKLASEITTPCGITYPICNGNCAANYTCENTGSACECVEKQIPCSQQSTDSCYEGNWDCPEGYHCEVNDSQCACVLDPILCGPEWAPACNAPCPADLLCTAVPPNNIYCDCVLCVEDSYCTNQNTSCSGTSYSKGGFETGDQSCYSNAECTIECGSSCTQTAACDDECGVGQGYSADGGITCYSDPDCTIQEGCCVENNALCEVPCGGSPAYALYGACYSDSSCSNGCNE